MEKGKLIRLIILSALVIVLAIVAATLLNQKSYSVLYSGMDATDAGEVLQMLEDMGVDAKTRGDDTILVETSQADTVRMQLAAQGYPNSGQNFDIFQNASGLGTTDMEKEVYYQFQIQENLRRTIEKMDKVEEAVVNINPSQESAFVLSDNESSATAAVMLQLKNGQR
jgi:flagellar M-ring protein FliF